MRIDGWKWKIHQFMHHSSSTHPDKQGNEQRTFRDAWVEKSFASHNKSVAIPDNHEFDNFNERKLVFWQDN
jgi:hypothetical protein